MDGFYGLPSGHLEAGETLQQGVIREAAEEVGLHLRPEDLEFSQLMHRKSTDGLIYLDAVFQANGWTGEPENLEPDKCDHLAWFPYSSLPQNTVPYVVDMIHASFEKRTYTEHGWNL
jgi:ADP-ribose pyrophosphatase YjhB (NUDIX family)